MALQGKPAEGKAADHGSMTTRTMAFRLTGDLATVDEIVARVGRLPGMEPEAILQGVQARLEGYRQQGLRPSPLTILHALDAAVAELAGERATDPDREPGCGVHGANSTSAQVPQRNGGTALVTESRPLSALTLVELLSQASPEIQWQVQDLLPVEGVAILAGPPGCGKTWMLADLAIELSRGGLWMGRFLTRRGAVLCIDEESPTGLLPIRYRRLLLAKSLGTESADMHFCNGQGFSFSRSGDVARLRDVLERIKPSLVIVDSLIRVHSAEENSASEMSAIFAVVKALARDFHCAFLFADHMRKGKPGDTGLDQMVRGSTDKAAFVDTLLVVTKTEVGLVVEHAKSRFAEAVPGFVVALEDPEPGATSVTYIGDARALKQERLRSQADPIVEKALDGGDWVSRQEIVDQGAKVGVTRKAIDATLTEGVKQGRLERDDRRPGGGKGNRSAFYRRSSASITPPARQQRDDGSNGDDDSPDPGPGSFPTNTGETRTGPDASARRPFLPQDPVLGSPTTSSDEFETASQEES